VSGRPDFFGSTVTYAVNGVFSESGPCECGRPRQWNEQYGVDIQSRLSEELLSQNDSKSGTPLQFDDPVCSFEHGVQYPNADFEPTRGADRYPTDGSETGRLGRPMR
jgi:hypothetical protein